MPVAGAVAGRWRTPSRDGTLPVQPSRGPASPPAPDARDRWARIRFLAAENIPMIVGYDQERWAVVFDYHRLPLEASLAVVEAVRAATVVLLGTMPDEVWSREGHHTESGRYTAEDWLAPNTSRAMPDRSSRTSRRGRRRAGRDDPRDGRRRARAHARRGRHARRGPSGSR
jgi:hypothetical protein